MRTTARLLEMAQRADRTDRCCFTPFLTPPETELAFAAARKARVDAEADGGYPNAERRMVRFHAAGAEEQPFPIVALELSWGRGDAPEHRDLLGSVMGLGINRSVIGDIVMQKEQAYLFASEAMAQHIADSLSQAGRTALHVALLPQWPQLAAAEGQEVRCTVSSARLDAILAEGFHLSRGKAAELIEAGQVKLRFQQTLRPDARVEAEDVISARGFGRLTLTEIGLPTRKGRLPIRLLKYGK